MKALYIIVSDTELTFDKPFGAQVVGMNLREDDIENIIEETKTGKDKTVKKVSSVVGNVIVKFLDIYGKNKDK